MEEAQRYVEGYFALPSPLRCCGRVEVVDDECDVSDDAAGEPCRRKPIFSVRKGAGLWKPSCHLPSTSLQRPNEWEAKETLEPVRDQRRFYFANRNENVWQLLHHMPFRGWISASRVPDVFGLGYNSVPQLIRDLKEGPPPPSEYKARIMQEGAEAEPHAIYRFLFVEKIVPPTSIFVHGDVMGLFIEPDCGVLAATPDCAFIMNGQWTLVEIKCPQKLSNDMDKYWKYLIQVVVQLGCCRIGTHKPRTAYVYVWDGQGSVVLSISDTDDLFQFIQDVVVYFTSCVDMKPSVLKKGLDMKTRVKHLKDELFSRVRLEKTAVGPLVWIEAGQCQELRIVSPLPDLDWDCEPMRTVTRIG